MKPGLERTLKGIGLAVLLSLILVIAYASGLHALVEPPLVKAKARRLLAAAKTPEELEKVTGKYGLYLPLTNEMWVGICYHDSHAGVMWSKAIALTSGGEWFESEYHFCGRFRIYRVNREKNQIFAEKLRKEGASPAEIAKPLLELDSDIEKLREATNPADIGQQLMAMGFRKIK